jgi:hypothetical protein
VRNTRYTDAITFRMVLLYAFIVGMMDILYLHPMLIVPIFEISREGASGLVGVRSVMMCDVGR